jgi:hypothetical protein
MVYRLDSYELNNQMSLLGAGRVSRINLLQIKFMFHFSQVHLSHPSQHSKDRVLSLVIE